MCMEQHNSCTRTNGDMLMLARAINIVKYICISLCCNETRIIYQQHQQAMTIAYTSVYRVYVFTSVKFLIKIKKKKGVRATRNIIHYDLNLLQIL